MKAIVYEKYGPPDVLRLREVDQPVPTDQQALLRVCATSVNAADLHMLRGDPFLVRLEFGLNKPKKSTLGLDVAGVVDAIGSGVTQFKPGDEVFGHVSSSGYGGCAEYACAGAKHLALKPRNIAFGQAAAVPVACFTALQALRDHGHIRAGQKVLINGASGGVGTFAVQLARHFGADVTATCSSRNVEMVRSLGAQQVIDYTREDVTKRGQRYELILACNGYHSLPAYRRCLSENGIYVCAGGTMPQIFQALLLGRLASKVWAHPMGAMLAKPDHEDLLLLRDLLESGTLVPVISACFPFSRAVEAFRYLDEGHAQGKAVIVMDPRAEKWTSQ